MLTVVKKHRELVDRYIGNTACICSLHVAGEAAQHIQFMAGTVVNVLTVGLVLYAGAMSVIDKDSMYLGMILVVGLFNSLFCAYAYIQQRRRGHSRACSRHAALVRVATVGDIC
jgi:hypothetical protein